MIPIPRVRKIQSVSTQRWITLGLIIALFLLRYMVTGFRMVYDESPIWIITVFEIGTYLLISILLILECESLVEYNINTLAIWIIILSKPFETIYLSIWIKQNASMTFPMAFPSVPSLTVWAIALGLLVHFRHRLFQRGAINWQDLRWVLIGCLVGLVTAMVTSYPESFEVTPLSPKRLTVIFAIGDVVLYMLYQLGFAAVSEEPVFRGFLWGFLQKNGWRDIWIWLLQAGLFLLGHLYYLKTLPIMFWFSIPLGGLVFGWLAWRSRSIATSMTAHGVMNGLGMTLARLVAFIRL